MWPESEESSWTPGGREENSPQFVVAFSRRPWADHYSFFVCLFCLFSSHCSKSGGRFKVKAYVFTMTFISKSHISRLWGQICQFSFTLHLRRKTTGNHRLGYIIKTKQSDPSRREGWMLLLEVPSDERRCPLTVFDLWFGTDGLRLWSPLWLTKTFVQNCWFDMKMTKSPVLWCTIVSNNLKKKITNGIFNNCTAQKPQKRHRSRLDKFSQDSC